MTTPSEREAGTQGTLVVDAITHRVRAARLGAGMTQKQLADALGVNPITVSRWERGVTSPSLPRLRDVAAMTSSAISDLVRGDDTPPAYAGELAALRHELAETRAIVERLARALERMTQSRSTPSP